ncbi:DNA-directed RNA polymerase sigma-70 factor [Streptomyces globosus]|uniref:DNA-directed RNA polymerase sigma-70 factor n=1 Tax=Streptomyces globosus TaxID=68209 RepID=A0A344TVD8_9ACTN|nr:transcriptional regulator [Streptomyces globosus]AXE22609.1 DNA-directed RNA polymerase sigma-70 factor [Streptomyces globosus]
MTESTGEPAGLPTPEDRRRLREAADLTCEQVAERLGVTAAAVRSWEAGRAHPHGHKRAAYVRLLAHGSGGSGAGPVRRPSADGPSRPPDGGPVAGPAAPGDSAVGPPARAPRRPAARPAPAHRPGRTGPPPVPPCSEAPAEPAAPAQSPYAAPPGPAPEPGPYAAPAGPAPEPGPHTAPAGPAPEPGPYTAPPGPDPYAPAGAPSAGAAGDGSRSGADGPAGPRPAPGGEDTRAADPADEVPEAADPGPVDGPRAAFDALYRRSATALARQAYLLTGNRGLALEAVERAFQQAWARWPEVATDPDPVGWVRAAAHEYALSPWHRFRRAHRHPEPPAGSVDPADRVLMDAVLALPPVHRRTVLLYHAVGLDLPDTAAETEATTPTAGHRLLHAHDDLAGRIPAVAAAPPQERAALLHERLGALRPPVRLVPRPAAVVRGAAEYRARRWSRTVAGVTALLTAATAYTLATAPTRYEPPVHPGTSVSGVPPLSGPQRLTEQSRQLREKLRADPAARPDRLEPRPE